MFKSILVPLDGSALAEEAIGISAAIARASAAAIDVTLVHQPFPFAGFNDGPWNAEQWKDEEKYLASTAVEIETGAAVPTTHAVVSGECVEMICARAHDVRADLIVMTSHGRTGISRAWIGSVADGVIRRSAVPVLMLRAAKTKGARRAPRKLFKRVLVPLDGSALAASALGPACDLARCNDARLFLLRVVQPVPLIITDVGMPYAATPFIPDDAATRPLVAEAKKEMAAAVSSLAERGVTDVKSEVVVDPRIAQAIIDAAHAHEVDAIAMSTHGRGMSRLVMGSVADKVIRASGLPVLLRRPVTVTEEPRNAMSAKGADRVGTQTSGVA